MSTHQNQNVPLQTSRPKTPQTQCQQCSQTKNTPQTVELGGPKRTLYCLRHTYATFELLTNGTDIHTLGKKLVTSVAMLKRHYSKLTATMAAARLAQNRIDSKT